MLEILIQKFRPVLNDSEIKPLNQIKINKSDFNQLKFIALAMYTIIFNQV